MQRILGSRRAVGVLAMVLLWPVSAAQADHADHGAEHPGGAGTTCTEVLDGKPAGWELKQETVPEADSEVLPGDVIEVRLTWDHEDFADAPLYQALDCVTVDGAFAESLSLVEQSLSLVEPGAANDGDVIHSFAVPDGLVAGTEICSRGAIAGDGNGYFELNPSNDACFVVAESPTPPTPPTPPAEETPPPVPPTPPAEVTPPVPAVVPLPNLQSPPEVEPQVQGATEERPAPAPQAQIGPEVAAVQSDALPRTGRSDRTLFLLAGLLLAFGGAAVTLAVRRPVRSGAGAGRRPSR